MEEMNLVMPIRYKVDLKGISNKNSDGIECCGRYRLWELKYIEEFDIEHPEYENIMQNTYGSIKAIVDSGILGQSNVERKENKIIFTIIAGGETIFSFLCSEWIAMSRLGTLTFADLFSLVSIQQAKLNGFEPKPPNK